MGPRPAPAQARGAEEAQRVELQHTLPKVNQQRHAVVVGCGVLSHCADHGLRGHGDEKEAAGCVVVTRHLAGAGPSPDGANTRRCMRPGPCDTGAPQGPARPLPFQGHSLPSPAAPLHLRRLLVPHNSQRVGGGGGLSYHARQRARRHADVAGHVGRRQAHGDLRSAAGEGERESVGGGLGWHTMLLLVSSTPQADTGPWPKWRHLQGVRAIQQASGQPAGSGRLLRLSPGSRGARTL